MDLSRENGHVSKPDIFFVAKGPHGKFLICIENAKIEKIKTYFSSKTVSKENYVFQNAKYVGRGKIKNFP